MRLVLKPPYNDTVPVITIIGGGINQTAPLVFYQFEEYIEYGATAFDEQDGDLTDYIEISSNVNMQEEGFYQVTYSVTDSDGNAATAYRYVSVEP